MFSNLSFSDTQSPSQNGIRGAGHLAQSTASDAPPPSAGTPGDGRGLPVPGRWLGVGLLTVIYVLNYMDRQILAILIEPIKADIALTDTQVGLLTGTLFAVFYSIITIPVAMLADRMNRIWIIAIGCFLWSCFTGLSGLAVTFLALAIARIGVAFGEAGGVAPSLSILGDYFTPRRRVIAISLFTCASPMGIMAGAMAGGLISAEYGWRAVFYFAAILGIIAAPLLIWFAPEPPRGNYEKDAPGRPLSLPATVALFFQLPTLGWMALSCGFFAMIANGLITWMPAVLMRVYGASGQHIALYYGPVIGISLMIGLFSSGAIISWFAQRSLRAFAIVPAIAMLLCAPLFALALTADTWQMVLLWSFVPIALINFVVPPALTLVQNLAPPEARSTASAVLMLVLNLVGIGLGPLVVGMASDYFSREMGDDGLRYAMMVSLVPIMILTAITLFIAATTVVRDHERVAAPV